MVGPTLAAMARLRVHNFAISLDGYCAGLNQSRDKPFGDVDVPGPSLHDTVVHARIVRTT